MRKIKGDSEDSSLLFSPTLCLYIFLSLALPSFLFRSSHLPTFFVRKCLLNKLTVLWRVISKAQRRSVLMLNLFCIHLCWRGRSALPSWSYSSPSSSGLRDTHLIPLICSWKHTPLILLCLCFSIFVVFTLSTPVWKGCDHFSGSGYKDLRQQWCSKTSQSYLRS